MKRKNKIPRQYSLVKLTDEVKNDYSSLVLWKHLLFLGEIPNMRGHCAVVDGSGAIKIGYHTENFVELNEEEV